MALIDLTGQRFGRLIVLRRAQGGVTRHAKWHCLCDCGRETISFGQCLRSGESSSCGCRRSELITARQTTHGLWGSREYRIWNNMLQRVTNPTNKNFHNYGGRGIDVCADWLNFERFFIDMGPCPPRNTLERLDNDGPYEKANCLWAPRTVQARNTRRTNQVDVGIYRRSPGTFEVRIRAEGRRIHIGTFRTRQEARAARRTAEVTHWSR